MQPKGEVTFVHSFSQDWEAMLFCDDWEVTVGEVAVIDASNPDLFRCRFLNNIFNAPNLA